MIFIVILYPEIPMQKLKTCWLNPMKTVFLGETGEPALDTLQLLPKRMGSQWKVET